MSEPATRPSSGASMGLAYGELVTATSEGATT